MNKQIINRAIRLLAVDTTASIAALTKTKISPVPANRITVLVSATPAH